MGYQSRTVYYTFVETTRRVNIVVISALGNWWAFSCDCKLRVFSGSSLNCSSSYRNGLQEWECKTTTTINVLATVVPVLISAIILASSSRSILTSKFDNEMA